MGWVMGLSSIVLVLPNHAFYDRHDGPKRLRGCVLEESVLEEITQYGEQHPFKMESDPVLRQYSTVLGREWLRVGLALGP